MQYRMKSVSEHQSQQRKRRSAAGHTKASTSKRHCSIQRNRERCWVQISSLFF